MIIPTKILVFALLFSASGSIFSQENKLLERDFWKQNPDLTTVKSTVEAGNDPSQLNADAFDAVVYALLEDTDKEVINYLLSFEGNTIEKATHDGRTYIFWAAYSGDTAIMKVLLSKGAKLNVKDTHGNTPLTFAAGSGQTNSEVYELFEKYGVNISEQTNREGANALLLIAPYINDASEMDYFLKKGLKIESKDDKGNGIFNYASRNGNIDLLEQLIEKGIDYKSSNDEAGNAFLFAAQGSRGHSNSIAVFEFLEKIGLDPAMVTYTGYTPLHRLAYSADKNIINFFIEKGAKADQKDQEGHTPFLNAASRNSLDVIKLLAGNINKINHTNTKGQNALMLAVKYNKADVVEYLLQQGIEPQGIDRAGNNLAFYLFTSGSEAEDFQKKFQLLQHSNVSFDDKQAEGNNLYHIITEANDLERLEKLSGLEIDINARNKNGLTPLHIAAMKAKSDEILKYLISQGADTQIKTDFEESVYDLASENELLTKNNVALNFLQ